MPTATYGLKTTKLAIK